MDVYMVWVMSRQDVGKGELVMWLGNVGCCLFLSYVQLFHQPLLHC
jgi:hypothetical protein